MTNKSTIRVDNPELLPDALTVFDRNDQTYAGVQAIKQVTKILSVYDDIEDYGDLIAAAIFDLSPESKVAVLNLYDFSELRMALVLIDTGMPLSEVEDMLYVTDDSIMPETKIIIEEF